MDVIDILEWRGRSDDDPHRPGGAAARPVAPRRTDGWARDAVCLPRRRRIPSENADLSRAA